MKSKLCDKCNKEFNVADLKQVRKDTSLADTYTVEYWCGSCVLSDMGMRMDMRCAGCGCVISAGNHNAWAMTIEQSALERELQRYTHLCNKCDGIAYERLRDSGALNEYEMEHWDMDSRLEHVPDLEYIAKQRAKYKG